MNKNWINTKVEFEWNKELQQYVEVSSEGYWYEGEMALATLGTPIENEGGTGGTAVASISTTRIDVIDPHLVQTLRDTMAGEDFAARLGGGMGGAGGGGGGSGGNTNTDPGGSPGTAPTSHGRSIPRGTQATSGYGGQGGGGSHGATGGSPDGAGGGGGGAAGNGGVVVLITTTASSAATKLDTSVDVTAGTRGAGGGSGGGNSTPGTQGGNGNVGTYIHIQV